MQTFSCRHALLIVTSTTLVLGSVASGAQASTLSTQLRHARIHLHRAELRLAAAKRPSHRRWCRRRHRRRHPWRATSQDPLRKTSPAKHGTPARRRARAKKVVQRWHRRVRTWPHACMRSAASCWRRHTASGASSSTTSAQARRQGRRRVPHDDARVRRQRPRRQLLRVQWPLPVLPQHLARQVEPWRSCSIFDGWAQIRATCYAIHRGYGPACGARPTRAATERPNSFASHGSSDECLTPRGAPDTPASA